MIGILISFICNAIALYIVASVVPGISVSNTMTLIIAAIVIGLINAFIKPVLKIISLPITIITLGLFAIIINALCLGLAAFLVPGFHIDGIIAAIIGAIVLSIVSMILGMVTKTLDKVTPA